MEAPTVSAVNAIVHKAISVGASDIHFEPQEKELHIRFRIDGLLYHEPSISKAQAFQLLSRIKVLAGLDIAEKRLPQDGKFQFSYAFQTIDIRVSTFPSVYGEKIVLRILDRTSVSLSINKLGLHSEMLSKLQELLIDRPHGFFLVTGPTGSGKTTTLYSFLKEMASSHKNTVTLEDPIEYYLPGITQTQIQPDIGFSFSAALRAVMRQDPDIIMVGEIRDNITAQVAIQAALTGHMILSTLHTPDAISVIPRLYNMGIENFLLSATLTGILAQRLVRVLCPKCKYPLSTSKFLNGSFGQMTLPITASYASTGCSFCYGTGYKGRTGIFELVIINSQLQEHISRYASITELYELIYKSGFSSLLDDGISKVNQGIISLSDLLITVPLN